MRPNTFLAIPPSGAYRTLRVDKFDIDYRSDGSISQFYSDLSVLNSKGQPTSQKQISVNDPLRFEGITMYQVQFPVAFHTGRTASVDRLGNVCHACDSRVRGITRWKAVCTISNGCAEQPAKRKRESVCNLHSRAWRLQQPECTTRRLQ